jgi:hypothetical protein
VRPECGFCVRNGARCIYGDEQQSGVLDSIAQHPSTTDQGEVIHRLDELRELLLQINQRTAKPFTSFPCPPPFGVDSALPGRSPWKRFSSVQTPEEVLGPPSAHRNAEGSRFTFSALRPEAILRWPTLRSVVPVELLEIDSFPLSSDHEKPRHGSQGPTTTEGPGIRDEDFIPLCSKFLEQVHPRNPVLDEAELRRQAQTATEYGLQYDSSSCIVVCTSFR